MKMDYKLCTIYHLYDDLYNLNFCFAYPLKSELIFSLKTWACIMYYVI